MQKTKVILVGESRVGKTSIINQYVECSFTDEYIITLTGDKLAKEVEIGGKKYNLEIWDTAGNEQFRAVNKIFMKNSKIAILVYDITDKKSFEELGYWYDQIINTNDKDNIIIGLAGNKSDKYEDQVVSAEEGQKYAEKINATFKETSAMDHESIDALFNQVLEKLVEKEKKQDKIEGNKDKDKDIDKDKDKDKDKKTNQPFSLDAKKITEKQDNEGRCAC